MIYCDASAIVTLVTGRTHASVLRSFLRSHPGKPLGTSTIGFIETVRTADQLGSFPGLLNQLLTRYTEILLTDEVRDLATLLPGGLRSLDAIHVASAQVLDDRLTVLITYDKRMAQAARTGGLPVAMPGLD